MCYSNFKTVVTDTLYQDISEPIHTLEMKIDGKISNGITMIYSHYPYERYDSLRFEGIISKTIKVEWYEPKCLILLVSESNKVNGEICIEYNFR